MTWDLALILLFLGAVVPFLGRRRMQRLLAAEKTSKRERLRLYASTVVSQWVAVTVIWWRARAHGIRPAQLGLAVPHVALAIIVTAVFSGLILTNQVLSLRQLALNPRARHGTMAQLASRIFPQDDGERAAFLAVVATVAFCEEFIYRGFVQAIFERWMHFALAAIFAASAMFAIAHLYQGWRGILSTLVVGILFSTIRWWTGSLLPAVVSHFVADIVAGYLAPESFRELENDSAI